MIYAEGTCSIRKSGKKGCSIKGLQMQKLTRSEIMYKCSRIRFHQLVLMLAFGESGIAERGRNRPMRWLRGKISGHDLARERGLGEQRDRRLNEIPLPVRPVQPLIGAKRSRDGPGSCTQQILQQLLLH